MMEHDHRVVEGCKLPSIEPLTLNERRWIEVLRDTRSGSVPAPTLAVVQALRKALSAGREGVDVKLDNL